jgi:hypothetical protein
MAEVSASDEKQKAPAHPPRPFIDRESPILVVLERECPSVDPKSIATDAASTLLGDRNLS